MEVITELARQRGRGKGRSIPRRGKASNPEKRAWGMRVRKRFGKAKAQNVKGECQEGRMGNPHLSYV